MKHFMLYLVIGFTLINIAFSTKFEITPLNINFEGVEVKNDTIYAYGDFGSLLISYDNGIAWKQVRAFDRGIIIGFFPNDTSVVAFNNYGEVAVSNDKGVKWNIVADFSDSILAVKKFSKGFFLRKKTKLFTIGYDYKLSNEYPFVSNTTNISLYTNSIAFAKGCLVACKDTSNYVIFDDSIKPIDTLTISAQGLISNSNKIEADSVYLYMHLYDLASRRDNIYRTKDFKSVEFFDSCSGWFRQYKIINEKYYALDNNKLPLRDDTKYDNYAFTLKLTDFTVSNNQMYVVGNNKLLEKIDLKDTTLEVLSEFSGLSLYISPDKINDSTYLFCYSDYNGKYSSFIYKTDNNGITFVPTMKRGTPYSSDFYFGFAFKYYDDVDGKLYLGGDSHVIGKTITGGVYITSDYGNSFTFTPLIYGNYMATELYSGSFYFPNCYKTASITKHKDIFVVVNIIKDLHNIPWTTIYSFNKNLESISYTYDLTSLIDYVHAIDTNTFLVHCANIKDSTSEVKFTNDKCATWDIIKKYPKSENLEYYKEILVNRRPYLALVHSDYLGTQALDIVDLETHIFSRVAEWFTPNLKKYSRYDLGIDSDSNFVYISYLDTLFCTNNIFNKKNWSYYIFPNGGRIVGPMQKFGSRYYAPYFDNNNPLSAYWLEPKDTITLGVDNSVEDNNYLYFYPPYPVPVTMGTVRSLIFWDMSLDIDNDDIGVYNLNGEKVSGRDKITIDKLNAYSGYLVWDCSNFINGTYLIQIKHGTRSSTLKILISR